MNHLEFLELVAKDPRVAVRVAGSDVAFASQKENAASFDAANLRVAALTAGLDPDVVEPMSGDYRAGASDALSSTLGTLSEMATRKDPRVKELEERVRELEDELLEARANVHVETRSRQRSSGLSE